MSNALGTCNFSTLMDLIGRDATHALSRAFGGLELSIPLPARLTGDHRLVDAVGIEAAEKLASEFGGSKIHPPLLKPTLKEQILASEGSLTEIAKRLGCTRAWVCKVRKLANPAPSEAKSK